MDHFTHDDLKQLAETTSSPSVSIYMPTHRAGREVRQNATRFKNMLKEATRRLATAGVDDRNAKSLIGKISGLRSNDDWWQHQSDGLAVFLAEGRADIYRLPLSFDEFVSVGPRFYIRPMLRLLQGDGRFYILAVSQNHVRLLEGTHYSVDELDSQQLPSDLRSALNIDEYTSTLQQHTTGAAVTAGSTMFHGQGAADMDVQKNDEISQYFKRIDEALSSFLTGERVPLVFAGVEYLFPLFRESCHYPGLLEQPLTGNPDELTAHELHEQAWPLVQPKFCHHRDEALGKCHINSDDATAGVSEIIRAARHSSRRPMGDGGFLIALACSEASWGCLPNLHNEGNPSTNCPGIDFNAMVL